MILCNFQSKPNESGHNVEHPAAENGGGAAEEGGKHQEDLRVPGSGGHQG